MDPILPVVLFSFYFSSFVSTFLSLQHFRTYLSVVLIFHIFLFNISPFFEVLPRSCFVIKKGMEKSAGILHSSKYLFGVFLFAVHFYNDVTTLSNWALFLFSSDFLLSIITFSKKYKQGILPAIKLFGDILR